MQKENISAVLILSMLVENEIDALAGQKRNSKVTSFHLATKCVANCNVCSIITLNHLITPLTEVFIGKRRTYKS